MNKKVLIFLQLWFLFFFSSAQNDNEEINDFKTDRLNYAPGYIYNEKGDTLYGQIKWRLGSRSKLVVFQGENVKAMSCEANDYEGFIRKDRQYYSCHLKFGYNVFLSKVIDGTVSLYMNEVTYEGTSGYGVAGLGAIGTAIDVANAASSGHSLFLHRHGEEDYLYLPKGSFKSKLKKYFTDCPELIQLIKKEKYNYYDMEKIVNYYNSKCALESKK